MTSPDDGDRVVSGLEAAGHEIARYPLRLPEFVMEGVRMYAARNMRSLNSELIMLIGEAMVARIDRGDRLDELDAYALKGRFGPVPR